MNRARKLILAAAAAAVYLAVPAQYALAGDTPSLGGGDCWRSGTPLTCVWNHDNIKGAVYFRAIDQFSNSRPSYLAPAQAAVNAWNSAPGPQYYSFSAHTNDVWTYLNLSTTGNNGLGANNSGIAWMCYKVHTRYGDIVNCEDSISQAVNIYYTNVYLNTNVTDGYGSAYLQHVFAHESGHGMGLAHNNTDSNAIMWPYDSSNGGPDSSDWGHYPGCSNGGAGTDCIYGSGD